MSDLTPLLDRLVNKYGLMDSESFVETDVPGVRFFQSCETTLRTPLVYEPGIVIICQGSKTGYLGSEVYHYDAQHYLLLTVPLPFECETQATKEDPLLGLFIDIDLGQLHKLVHLMSANQSAHMLSDNRLPESVAAVAWDSEMADIIQRLLKSLNSELDAQVLGPGLVNELLYHILRSENGQALYALSQHEGHYARIAKVMGRIHREYAQPYTVEALASQAGMSVSVFHRAFKQVTKQSPLQYLKRIKLFKAKGLIIHEGLAVSVAADRVGYESVSQFSREFKRMFSVAPSQSKDVGYAELN